MVETAGSNQLVDLSVNQAIVSSTHAQAATDLTSLSDVGRRQGVAQGQRARALADQAAADAALARDRTQVADTRLTASVTGTDLSLVVLDAYWRAAAAMAISHPSCHLGWPVLAGIGHVESGNGTYGGDSVGAGGEEARPVIGIALDGTGGTQRITDTDGGALDHDPIYDRAVGPMQVLPSAWRRYGLDGNGDGARDPQNLYDAAATAAVMLCRYGAARHRRRPADDVLPLQPVERLRGRGPRLHPRLRRLHHPARRVSQAVNSSGDKWGGSGDEDGKCGDNPGDRDWRLTIGRAGRIRASQPG